MRIYLSPRDCEFRSSVEQATGRDVHFSDEELGTYVDAADELAGATLLAEVRTILAECRGEI